MWAHLITVSALRDQVSKPEHNHSHWLEDIQITILDLSDSIQAKEIRLYVQLL